jgi:trimethylamine--corrinoid protein Co-methyltransferase
MVERLLRGITVEDETLALDLIERVGPAGSFVTEDHTLEHHREELLTCGLIGHTPRDTWEAAGAIDMRARARQEVTRLLAQHRHPTLPAQVTARLDEIVEAAQAMDGSQR